MAAKTHSPTPALQLLVAEESAACDLLWAGERASAGKVAARALRGTKMATRQGFFDECAAALQFPYYFGDNWDSFNDCINDLEWLRADKCQLWILHAVQLLAKETPEQFHHFVTVVQQASAGKKPKKGKELQVVLHATPKEEEALRARLTTLGVVVGPFVPVPAKR